MGYASYSENIAEKFNERLSDLLKVASQVRRGPAGSKDLSISHQQKLQQLLTDLGGLLSTLLKSLDDPAVAAKLSTKSLSEALSQALSQSAHLEETNRELHRQLEAGKKQANASARTLTNAREETARLEASNAKLRKASHEAKESIIKLQRAMKRVESEHSMKVQRMSREIGTLNGKVRDLETRNDELEAEEFKVAVGDVRSLKRK